ncbi:MAG: hypothetical protein Q9182_000371 [Xanthomendoza sp. 2 TL-2023]
MDIDLDAIFGGQGATDLDDDDYYYETPSEQPRPRPQPQPQPSSPHHIYPCIPHPRLYHLQNNLSDDRDLTLPDPSYRPPHHTLYERAPNGKFIFCDGINVTPSAYRPSQLRTIESAYTNTHIANSEDDGDDEDDVEDTPALSIAAPSPQSTPATSISLSPIMGPLDINTTTTSDPQTRDPDTITSSIQLTEEETSKRRSAIYMACVVGFSIIMSLW